MLLKAPRASHYLEEAFLQLDSTPLNWLTGSPLNAPSFVATGTMGDATVSVYTCELRVLGHVGVSLRK